MTDETYIIIGAGLAGSSAAVALRRSGFRGRIVLIGDEPHLPYLRPPLSKQFLEGYCDYTKVVLHPKEFYDQFRIILRLGAPVARLDVNARVVELNSGDKISYDRLLIATGSAVRRIAVPGTHLEGIYYLRTIDDAERIRNEITPGRRVVVVGAGFIGGEVASVCRKKGLRVTLVEMLKTPLQNLLGEQIGTIVANLHREHGVEVLTNEQVIAFQGDKKVTQVITASGKVLPCDFVVVGVGVTPATSWLEGTGIYIDNGVVVNEYCETNVPGIYAAGDVANAWHPLFSEHIRVEHETNAQHQGVIAARNMLGNRVPHKSLPFAWSDQYDLELRYIGHARPEDTVVLRVGPNSRSFLAFYLRDTEVRAIFGVNRSEEIEIARKLIERRIPVKADRLADGGTDLRTLLGDSAI